MNILSWPGITGGATDRPDRPGRARAGRKAVAIAALATVILPVVGTSNAMADIVTENTKKLVDAGPVNTANGYPAWYEDADGTRLELCWDVHNPLCGVPIEEGFDPGRPASFPDNWSGETFYHQAGAQLAQLPGGGSAKLTLALESTFAVEVVRNGDQVVFGRQRIDVRDAAPNSTYRFTTPYGVIDVNTDGSGRGRFVEDVGVAPGNFDLALASNIGPFLKWTEGAPEGYVGNPDIDHAVTGSPFNTNYFEGALVAAEGQTAPPPARTDLFSVSGKIATNKGVQADDAALSADGKWLDIFATSEGGPLQVDGTTPTPMIADPAALATSGPKKFYTRIAVPEGQTPPAEVTVSNIGDDPVSTSKVRVSKRSGVIITQATYDGAKQELTVAAISATGAYPLEAVGYGALTGPEAKSYPTWAPPASITVKSSTGTATSPVTVVGGEATTSQPSFPAQNPPNGGVVTEETPPSGDTTGSGTTTGGTGTTGSGTTTGGGTTAPAPPTATVTAPQTTLVNGGFTALDGSNPTPGATYAWTQVSGPTVNIAGADTAKPIVSVKPFTTATATAPATGPVPSGPAVIQLVVTANGRPSAPATVTIQVSADTVTATGGRHRVGKEFRLDGTAASTATVVVWDVTNGRKVKIGTAVAGATGAWSLRLKPGPTAQVSNVLVQSSGGGEARTTVANR